MSSPEPLSSSSSAGNGIATSAHGLPIPRIQTRSHPHTSITKTTATASNTAPLTLNTSNLPHMTVTDAISNPRIITTPVNKTHAAELLPGSATPPIISSSSFSPRQFSPRQFSPSNFESVLHLPSPMVMVPPNQGQFPTGDSMSVDSQRTRLIDYRGNGPSSGSEELKIGKIRHMNQKLRSDTHNSNLRMISEYNPVQVRQNDQLQPSFQMSPPILKHNLRNFTSPLTSTFDETTASDNGSDTDTSEGSVQDNVLLQDQYVAFVKTVDGSRLPKHTYSTLKKIGKGSFSIVVLAEDVVDHSRVAIKISKVPDDSEKTRSRVESSVRRELDILESVSHASIIELLLSNVENEEKVVIVMPYCVGGDLYSFVSHYRQQVSSKVLQKMFCDLVSAVRYLHHNDIVHRDLKLENLVIKFPQESLLAPGITEQHLKEAGSLVALTDFGLSKKLESPDTLLTTRCGSEDYVSPELMMGIPYDGKKNDIWALGVLLYSVIESRLPFDPPPLTANSHISSASQRMRQTSLHRILLINWDWYTYKDLALEEDYPLWDGAKDIVERCLVRKEKRIDIDELAAMEWCRSYLD